MLVHHQEMWPTLCTEVSGPTSADVTVAPLNRIGTSRIAVVLAVRVN